MMTLKKKHVKIRLYHSEGLLDSGAEVVLNSDKAHYVRDVMRAKTSDPVVLFDGVQGDWFCVISKISSRYVKVRVETLVREYVASRELTLFISLVKKEAMRNVVRQATEMGVTLIQLIRTEYSAAGQMSTDKLRTWAIEAAEQCGRHDIPVIPPVMAFRELHTLGKKLILCDETGGGQVPGKLLHGKSNVGVIIGPEGGFSRDELDYAATFSESMSLGSRVLRVDTAVVAALAYVNEYCNFTEE
ncbi:16S rRNA (uracil(1498)-N(3))-methyltransferase [Candidatus Anaplasma sp. TIGMIC]|uniref:16S rRNA (uracil(1498)-N(3))-methyltransferase n=1 Tax=Candidatus Anaplasma sp. TIGMIC TaxID=3020713 RepID=UPI00232CB8A4|nr:16S rRNA (uracil(1498)-N(3))-methyltransferase [Candidatus Anaplasma sp. TIGMIC]MDB1135595.1 16S rRNA (uracil(1498)-N(3))-methyltransferase [Candidatus Anaplasma sp. TIGMIC]